MAGLVRLLRQKWNLPTEPTTSLTGRTIIITGSNVGLGFEAAVKTVALGAAKVILAVRSTAKGKAAQSEIELRTGKTGVIEVWPLDMLSYDSIKSFADRASTLDHLDIAILNAGIMSARFEESSYGWETTLQVNVLSTTLLALLLLPKLKLSKMSGSTPVLEIVSSGLHRGVFIPSTFEFNPLEAYNDTKNFAPQPQYSRSKFFIQCAVKAIAQLAGTDNGEPTVLVTSVCPGACKSELGRAFTNLVLRMVLTLFQFLFMRSTEGGSRTLVSGALLDSTAHGRFWKDEKIQEDSPNLTGENGRKMQEIVWHDIVNALRKDIPDILQLTQP